LEWEATDGSPAERQQPRTEQTIAASRYLLERPLGQRFDPGQ